MQILQQNGFQIGRFQRGGGFSLGVVPHHDGAGLPFLRLECKDAVDGIQRLELRQILAQRFVGDPFHLRHAIAAETLEDSIVDNQLGGLFAESEPLRILVLPRAAAIGVQDTRQAVSLEHIDLRDIRISAGLDEYLVAIALHVRHCRERCLALIDGQEFIESGDLFEVRGGGSGYVDRPAAIPPAAGAQQRRSKQTKDSFHTHKTEAVRKSYIPYRETMCR